MTWGGCVAALSSVIAALYAVTNVPIAFSAADGSLVTEMVYGVDVELVTFKSIPGTTVPEKSLVEL